MTRKRWMVVLAAAVVLVVVAGVLVAVRLLGEDDASERARRAWAADATFADVLALAPDNARRLLWTDWGGVRDEVGLDLDAGSSSDQVEELLDRGFDADLTSTTALVDSASVMQEQLGFSPASLEWELFAQSDSAATLTMRLGGGVSTDDVADALRTVGYVEPDRDDGTWTSTTNDPIAGTVTPELAFIALDADDGLVFASDTAAGVTVAVQASADAGADAVPLPAGVVDSLGSPLAAAAYDSTVACSTLALANADPGEQAEGESLVAAAGRVNPLTGFGIGAEPGGDVRVTMGFDTADQARTNADTRAKLASGPAPGQGGDFADRFAVGEVTADGTVVRLDLQPVEGAFVLSDLSTGPVLFATC